MADQRRGGFDRGGDIALRLDLAETLCTLALLTSADRAIASGTRVLGQDKLLRALPALQPVGLSPETRHAMRKRKDLMKQLRESLLEVNRGAAGADPAGAAEAEDHPDHHRRHHRRLHPADAAGTGEPGSAGIPGRLALGAAALLLSAGTYLGAAMSLTGFVPEKLSMLRTILAQLAASFATWCRRRLWARWL